MLEGKYTTDDSTPWPSTRNYEYWVGILRSKMMSGRELDATPRRTPALTYVRFAARGKISTHKNKCAQSRETPHLLSRVLVANLAEVDPTVSSNLQ